MIPFNHPTRPRLGNGLPTWLDAPSVALPQVLLKPDQGAWAATVMVWRVASESGGFVGRRVTSNQLAELLGDWEAGPEQALVKWWGELPPRELKRKGEQSAEELGL